MVSKWFQSFPSPHLGLSGLSWPGNTPNRNLYQRTSNSFQGNVSRLAPSCPQAREAHNVPGCQAGVLLGGQSPGKWPPEVAIGRIFFSEGIPVPLALRVKSRFQPDVLAVITELFRELS